MLQENAKEGDGELGVREHPDHSVLVYASLSYPAGSERIAGLYRADHLEDR